jgi:hypothetical protein
MGKLTWFVTLRIFSDHFISHSSDQFIDQTREIQLLLTTDHSSILRLFGLHIPFSQTNLSISKSLSSDEFDVKRFFRSLPSQWSSFCLEFHRHFECNVSNCFPLSLSSLSPYNSSRFKKTHNILFNDKLDVVICHFPTSRFGDLWLLHGRGHWSMSHLKLSLGIVRLLGRKLSQLMFSRL